MSKQQLEVRSFSAEIRSADVQDNQMIVEGYALKFNSLSQSFGNWREIIDPHALDNCDMSDVRCLVNHDTTLVLGRNTSGTLELNVDDVGLYFKCIFPNTSYAKDLFEVLKRGDVNQMSFGFFLAPNGDTFSKDPENEGMFIRTLKEIEKIYEVSIVTIPAYEETNVEIAQRSIKRLQEEFEKEKELLLLQLELDKYQI
ncbi:HK97 family phage prohead protease [Bacillus smithii]|uniref:HK97 family phage prohead protease n=1 Tax=Bacillus smithii TaxID=1479 RepID=UPI003D242725